jgi:N-acetylglucosaminyl-diphospho-decaprenol L-rhamnosyltransferase
VTEAVGIVTVSFDSSVALAGLLASVPDAGLPVAVTVVDNDSPDRDSVSQVVSRYGVELLPLDRNLGYGGAVNRGVGRLPAEVAWVLVANPDIVLHPGSVAALVDAAERDPRVGSAGPRILNPDGTVYPSARRLPSLRTGIGHALFGSVWRTNPWSRSYLDDGDDSARDVGWLSGACLLVRREAFESIGGFDDGYFMYFEDVDLGARLARAGWVNRYVPTATVTHAGAHSTSKRRTEMERAHHRSAYRYVARKYSAWYLWPLRVALRAGLAVRERLAIRRPPTA